MGSGSAEAKGRNLAHQIRMCGRHPISIPFIPPARTYHTVLRCALSVSVSAPAPTPTPAPLPDSFHAPSMQVTSLALSGTGSSLFTCSVSEGLSLTKVLSKFRLTRNGPSVLSSLLQALITTCVHCCFRLLIDLPFAALCPLCYAPDRVAPRILRLARKNLHNLVDLSAFHECCDFMGKSIQNISVPITWLVF